MTAKPFNYFALYSPMLNLSASTSIEMSWLYHDPIKPDSQIFYGAPYRYIMNITNILPTPMSINDPTVSGEPGYYDALSLRVGDWISGSDQSARVLRIIDILSVSANTATIVVEDTERYNVFQNRTGYGDPTISDGGLLFFRVEDNIPYLQCFDNSNINSPNIIPIDNQVFNSTYWATDIMQRFEIIDREYGFLYEFINHSYSEGQLLKVAKASNVLPSTVTGSASPSVNAGDTARIGDKIVTFPSLSTPQEIVTWFNNQMFLKGTLVASLLSDGELRLTCNEGYDAEIYDISGSTISSLLNLSNLCNGIYEGKLIALEAVADVPVAIINRLSVDPNKFYIKWLGEKNETIGFPGEAGDILYIDNLGQYTTTKTARGVAIKVNSTIPAITIGTVGATTTNNVFALNGIYVTVTGSGTVDDCVTAINNSYIQDIRAYNFNGALKIINGVGGVIMIDNPYTVTDLGLKPNVIGVSEQIIILNIAALTPELSNLADVDVTNLVDGNILVWNSTTGKWEAKSGAKLEQLSDVNAANAVDGQIIKYNATTQTWEAVVNDLQLLHDVNINDLNLSQGDILAWNNTSKKWEAKSGSSKLEQLTDVNLSDSSVTNRQILRFNSTTGKWEASINDLQSLADVNVTDSTLSDGNVLTWNNTTKKWEAKIVSSSGSGMTHIIQDTTPELGGDLVVGTHKIVADGTNPLVLQAHGGDIIVDGDGSQAVIEGYTKSDIIISGGVGDITGAGGNVILRGGANPVGQQGNVIVQDNTGTPIVKFKNGTTLTANYITIQNSGTGNPVTISAEGSTNIDISIIPKGTGKVILANAVKILNNIWPTTDGTAGQTLITDGSGNLSWQTPSSGGNGGYLDAPTDGSFSNPRITGGKPPAITTWNIGTTKISDAIDDLNEVLGLLLPSAPPNLSTKTIAMTGGSNTRGGIAINTTSNITNNTGSSVTGGQQIYTIFSATATTNSVTNFGSGNSGILTALLNNTADGQITLQSTSNVGSNLALQITRNDDYPLATPGFYKDLDATISGIVNFGVNTYKMTHSETGSTNTLMFVYDNFTSAPLISSTSVTQNAAAITYSSSVPHYNTGSTLKVSFSAYNLSGMTYLNSNVVEIDSTPSIGSMVALNPSDMPSATSGVLPKNCTIQNISNKIFTIAPYNFTIGNMYIRGRNSYTDGAYATDATKILVMSGSITPTASTPIQEMAVLVYNLGTTPSGAPVNAQRIHMSNGDTPNDDPTTATWNSQNPLQTYEAAIVGGVLSHNQINYGTGAYLPIGSNLSSSRNGSQYITFYFRRSGVSQFKINVTGTYDGCYVKLPGASTGSAPNGWWDMTALYTGNGIPGSNGSNGCAVGSVMNKTTGIFTCTFGQESSSNSTQNYILVRFRMVAGNAITNLSFSS